MEAFAEVEAIACGDHEGDAGTPSWAVLFVARSKEEGCAGGGGDGGEVQGVEVGSASDASGAFDFFAVVEAVDGQAQACADTGGVGHASGVVEGGAGVVSEGGKGAAHAHGALAEDEVLVVRILGAGLGAQQEPGEARTAEAKEQASQTLEHGLHSLVGSAPLTAAVAKS